MARICVLDDDLDGVALIQRILTRKGHLVRVFTAEEEAVAYASRHRVDLALVDSDFGGMNGGIGMLEAFKRIGSPLRVIILAQYPTNVLAKQAREAGAADYCIKPVDKSELERKVAAVLATGLGQQHITQELVP